MSRYLAFLAIALTVVVAARVASPSGPSTTDKHVLLGDRVLVRADGRGFPWITLRDGRELPAAYTGGSNAADQLSSGAATPVSLATADFDEDGVADLACGYAGTKGGVVSLHRGDAFSIYPNSPEAVATSSVLPESLRSPFLLTATAFETPSVPSYLAAGDFNLDGHFDLASAQSGGNKIYLYYGDGGGSFDIPQVVALPGKITAFASADVNRIDGIDDLVVGVSDSKGARLLVYESHGLAFSGQPESLPLPSEARTLAIAQMGDDYLIDIVVATGRDLLIINGVENKAHAAGSGAPPRLSVNLRITLPAQIVAVTTGDYTGGHHLEIASLTSDGALHIYGREGRGPLEFAPIDHLTLPPFDPVKSLVSAPLLVTARLSCSPHSDLLVIDPASRLIHVFINESARTARGLLSQTLIQGATLDVEGTPRGLLPMRLNRDSLSDLVVITDAISTPVIAVTTNALTFSVTTTDDNGDNASPTPGSLRKAILDANANPGADIIDFSIPGFGTKIITPPIALPTITSAVTLDATTQSPGSSVPAVEINGINAGDGTKGIRSIVGNNTVRGLALYSFGGNGIELGGSGNNIEGNFIGLNAASAPNLGNGETGVVISGGMNNTVGGTTVAARNCISSNIAHGILVLGPASGNNIRGNFIGTDAAGAVAFGNISDGISMVSGSNNVNNNIIGGATAGAGNLVSGNVGAGVRLLSAGTSNLVQGNLIGTDATGLQGVGNNGSGVEIIEAANNTIGGSTIAARNVVSGNSFNGVRINGVPATGNLVQGNYIGLGIDGARPLGNRQGGIYFINSPSLNTIGGAAVGQANAIAFNGLAGVFVETGNQNQIISNSIFSNDGLGIDLSPIGVTVNDATDADAGPNNLQNFPVLTLASSAPGGMSVQGSLTSTPSTSFTLQFFSSSGCDPAGHGEGRTFLGSASVTTGAGGVAAINLILANVPALGESITATATDPQGNTSEFSACISFGRADLAVTKTASSSVIAAGSDFSYEITVRNNGPDTAINVLVADNLPAALSFLSCSTTGGGICTGTGNNRTVSFSSLAVGADARITIAARLVCSVANGTVIPNSATASSPLDDPVAGNNTGQVSVTASNSPATISPSSLSFARDGGESFVSVTAPPCVWTAQSNDSWITFPFGSSGIGNGGITVSVAPNSTGGARTGTATIAGRTLTINQSNQACSYSIAPQGGSFTHEGGAGQVNVTAPAGCRWKALSDSSWIIMNADTATGSGAATFTVEPNTGPARTGAITIEGLIFNVTQEQAPCIFSISPASAFVGVAGDDGSIEFITRADCAWTARASDSWIEIDSANSGVGNGMITYIVRDNATGAPRQGSISIGNAVFVIVQDSSANLDCSYTMSPQEDRFAAAGGSGSFTLRTDARCAWRALSSVNWITVTSVEVGIGSATITYLVKPNSTPTTRRGEIQIGSGVFAVKQKGG
jgi:uncharacterized repeat protein (TIGR01451 family)